MVTVNIGSIIFFHVIIIVHIHGCHVSLSTFFQSDFDTLMELVGGFISHVQPFALVHQPQIARKSLTQLEEVRHKRPGTLLRPKSAPLCGYPPSVSSGNFTFGEFDGSAAACEPGGASKIQAPGYGKRKENESQAPGCTMSPGTTRLVRSGALVGASAANEGGKWEVEQLAAAAVTAARNLRDLYLALCKELRSTCAQHQVPKPKTQHVPLDVTSSANLEGREGSDTHEISQTGAGKDQLPNGFTALSSVRDGQGAFISADTCLVAEIWRGETLMQLRAEEVLLQAAMEELNQVEFCSGAEKDIST